MQRGERKQVGQLGFDIPRVYRVAKIDGHVEKEAEQQNVPIIDGDGGGIGLEAGQAQEEVGARDIGEVAVRGQHFGDDAGAQVGGQNIRVDSRRRHGQPVRVSGRASRPMIDAPVGLRESEGVEDGCAGGLVRENQQPGGGVERVGHRIAGGDGERGGEFGICVGDVMGGEGRASGGDLRTVGLAAGVHGENQSQNRRDVEYFLHHAPSKI